jgi:hypothetical protein
MFNLVITFRVYPILLLPAEQVIATNVSLNSKVETIVQGHKKKSKTWVNDQKGYL